MTESVGWASTLGLGNRKTQIVLISTTVGVGVIGLWLRYSAQRRRRSNRDRVCNGHVAHGGEIRPSFEGAQRDPTQRSSVYIRDVSRSSTTSNATLTTGSVDGRSQPLSLGQDALIYSGMESLSEAINSWRQALTVGVMKGRSNNELNDCLELLLDKAQSLQTEITQFLNQHCPDAPDGLIVTRTRNGPSGSYYTSPLQMDGASATSYTLRKTMSILSDDSFMSALDDIVPIFDEVDVLQRDPLNYDPVQLLAYQAALKEVRRGRVPCRIVRTEAFRCSSDEEFLGKLHCLREAFKIVLGNGDNRDWLANEGKMLIGGLLRRANKDTSSFISAYDTLVTYVSRQELWRDFEDELRGRQVPMFTFYDVVLDFILMDAFDDLARPPASALAVAQNRFLSASFKESTLAAVVWSVLKAKRARLQFSDGFIAHFYDVSEQVSPTMAWGFLGTDEQLRDICYYFKDQICCFLMDIFSFERVRYFSFSELAEDVWLVMKRRAELTETRVIGSSGEFNVLA